MTKNCKLLPGILSNISTEMRGASFPWFCITNHLNAILMGVVKHEVNKSAGNSGFIGRSWVAEHAANWIQFRFEIGGPESSPDTPCVATCEGEDVLVTIWHLPKRSKITYLLVILSFVLFSKLFKAADDDAGIRAIIHENRRRTHPRLKIIQAQGYVLGVRPVENPNFAICRGFGYTVSVVMK